MERPTASAAATPVALSVAPLQSSQWRILRALSTASAEDTPAELGVSARDMYWTSPDEWQAQAASWSPPDAHLGVASVGGDAVGMLGIRRGTRRPCRAEAVNFWVAADHRHQGVASALIRDGLLWALRNEVTDLECHVLRSNRPAERIYRAGGMRRSVLSNLTARHFVSMRVNIAGLGQVVDLSATSRPPGGPEVG